MNIVQVAMGPREVGYRLDIDDMGLNALVRPAVDGSTEAVFETTQADARRSTIAVGDYVIVVPMDEFGRLGLGVPVVTKIKGIDEDGTTTVWLVRP